MNLLLSQNATILRQQEEIQKGLDDLADQNRRQDFEEQRRLEAVANEKRQQRAREIAEQAAAEAERRAIAEQAAKRAAEANTAFQRERLAREGTSGGTITKNGRTIVVPPSRAIIPPDGYVWLFFEPTDFHLAPRDPEDLTADQWNARVAESARRVKQRYAFLADKSDPRRRQFDAFVTKYANAPTYSTLFSLSCWPELAAAECARLNHW